MLQQHDSLLLFIDIQDKLVKMLGETDIPHKAQILAKSAQILDIPTIITEQYPKGLGATIEGLIFQNTPVFEKTSFNALNEKPLLDALIKTGKKQIIVCGIEGHICVYQTALALKEKGFEVYMIQDVTASRHNLDYQTALESMKQNNIQIITLEMALFELLVSSKHEHFKEIQHLIK